MGAREPFRFGAWLVAAVALLLAACNGAQEPTGNEAMNDDPQASLEQDVMDWRERRRNRLTEPYGYLSLVGLHLLEPGQYLLGTDPASDIVLARGPSHWGVLSMAEDRSVRFTVDPEAVGRVRIDDAEVESALLKGGDTPTRIESEGLRVHLTPAGDRTALRIRDPEAPTRTEFVGLDYFPIDPALRVVGRWEAHPDGHTMTMANVMGQRVEEPNPGRVVFELDGTQHALEAIDSDDDLFYILADRTSGRESYGLGRFLYSDLPAADGTVVLDFNRLYNPPCAFNAFTTCQLPPQSNRLDAWLRVGERTYAGPVGIETPVPTD